MTTKNINEKTISYMNMICEDLGTKSNFIYHPHTAKIHISGKYFNFFGPDRTEYLRAECVYSNYLNISFAAIALENGAIAYQINKEMQYFDNDIIENRIEFMSKDKIKTLLESRKKYLEMIESFRETIIMYL
jgi:hypothetical protein